MRKLPLFIVALFVACCLITTTNAGSSNVENLFVIFLENWSFDGLFGKFPGVDGIDSDSAKAKWQNFPQVDKNGTVYQTLPPDQKNVLPNNLPNQPVDLGKVIADKGPGYQMPHSEITHRYYQEQYQINNGSMNKFVAWSSASGMAFTYVDLSQDIFGQMASEGTVLDNFYHSAFGGSFLNHQWLICAKTPKYPANLLEANSTLKNLLVSTFDNQRILLKDNPLGPAPDYYAVNHIESQNPPLNPRTNPVYRLPSLNHPTIGDHLTDAGISWRWYSGGYNDAMKGNAPEYQYHHQPYIFFDRFKDPNSFDRKEHIRDETDLLRDLQTNNVPKISWYKPYGTLNFHPGSSNPKDGQKQLKKIVDAIKNSPYWHKSAIIITFDENGGRWDHVPPPIGDIWGPGTRVPALILSPWVKKGFVDHNTYETISILKFMESWVGLNKTVIPASRHPANLGKVFDDANIQPPTTAPTSPPGAISQELFLYIVVPVGVVVVLLVIGLIVAVIRRKGSADDYQNME